MTVPSPFRNAAICGARLAILLASLLAGRTLSAQSPGQVMIVVNDNSALSRTIGEYYARRRAVPARNICRIKAPESEEISREEYGRLIAIPVADFLRASGLVESVLYIVTTAGVPLKISGSSGLDGDAAAVDSELTLLYSDIKNGRLHQVRGVVPNPFFGKRDQAFSHPQFPMYLVTRLAAYDFNGVKALIDRSIEASAQPSNRGKFVIDLNSSGDADGNNWLRAAAKLLPKDRVTFDESTDVLYDQSDVIGYASWGSNDSHRHRRFLGYHWLPGAIMTEYVSTNGRTFARPPENWTISTWASREAWFDGSPQTLTADYIQEGATGASGHVYEPYLALTPRPDFVLPAYYSGRNLAESYYLGIRGLSWQNIVVGDPLCTIGNPR